MFEALDLAICGILTIPITIVFVLLKLAITKLIGD